MNAISRLRGRVLGEQALADRPVPAAARVGRQPRVDVLAEPVVEELELDVGPTRLAALGLGDVERGEQRERVDARADQPALDRRVQVGRDLDDRAVERRGEQRQLERAADAGGDLEGRAPARAEPFVEADEQRARVIAGGAREVGVPSIPPPPPRVAGDHPLVVGSRTNTRTNSGLPPVRAATNSASASVSSSASANASASIARMSATASGVSSTS